MNKGFRCTRHFCAKVGLLYYKELASLNNQKKLGVLLVVLPRNVLVQKILLREKGSSSFRKGRGCRNVETCISIIYLLAAPIQELIKFHTK